LGKIIEQSFEQVLTKKQASVLKLLGPIAKEIGFYLAGGTAAALYLRHRCSVDFDWFTSKKLKDPLNLAESLKTKGLNIKVTEFSPGTLHCTLKAVRVSFFEYTYPLISSLVQCDSFGFMIASLDDIACMKLIAIAQRGSKKDFVDIYAICKKHKPLKELLRLAKKKFDLEDISSILFGLTYFEDADRERMPKMLWKADWRNIKSEIKKWVKEASKHEDLF